MVNQSHLNVIPGRSAAEGKGIHLRARRYGSPFLACGSPGMTSAKEA